MSASSDQMYPFAVKMASWFCRRRSLRRGQQDDVLQDMLVGMSQATGRYDARRGVTFEAFARKRMIGEAIDGLARRGGVPRSFWASGIRCPQHLFEETVASKDFNHRYEADCPSQINNAYQALENFSPLVKRAVEAMLIDKMLAEDVAMELGVTTPHVRQLLARGIQLLRHELRDRKAPKEVIMDSSRTELSFSPAQWHSELRKTVRKLVTPEVIEQLVQRQIDLAKAGDRYALNFLLKQCGMNEVRANRSGCDTQTARRIQGVETMHLMRHGRKTRTV